MAADSTTGRSPDTTAAAAHGQAPPDGTGLIRHDPWLEPFANALRHRYGNYRQTLARIRAAAGSLEAFARGDEYLGFNRGRRGDRAGLWYREWAPAADGLFLIGEFNDWDRQSHPLTRDDQGVWSILLPDDETADRLVHGGRLKVHVHTVTGSMDRIPAYVRRAVYEPETSSFSGQHWCPPEPYTWRHPVPTLQGSPRIYEAHIGMAQEEARLGTFAEFTEQILPRIAEAGYNVIQLMAVQEHPYYGSFGYQVSNYFAVSSRFGTPEELKALIDAAHARGLLVLLDLVHSHSVKNLHEGLNRFDGTDHQYFHAGDRGRHPAWDSLLFDYAKLDVLRFLLSNVRFWLEEFRFDGFRFDGVTSMMYLHHGLGKPFTCYDDYLINDLDEDAIVYLQLANQLAHRINPRAITVAEDVSGMVGLARPVAEGGLGFDYRLAMGIPDSWIKILKERSDEDWPMGEIYHTLTNRRSSEKHISYAESHDQALVGDKTLAFRLMDAEMYWHMNRGSKSAIIDRGMALHKMIRLITLALGGEGYLNFMGNEFGHPEWIDFPRQGNDFSYQHARRQWSLLENDALRYRDLAAFDRAMLELDARFGVMADPFYRPILIDEERKLLVCHRGPILLAFNFHPNRSQPDCAIGAPEAVDYQVVLNTDDVAFGGHGLAAAGQVYPWKGEPTGEHDQCIQIYLPARTAQVMAPTARM